MKYLSLLTLAALLSLSGCSISAPGVHARVGDADAVHLDIGGYGGHGGGFCPPGHRMKGEC